MIPDVTVHGTWVRSLVHDGFGRLCWKVLDREYFGQVEFFVQWEPDEDLDARRHTGSYHNADKLVVRPYKPRPWIVNPPTEVKYRQWAEEHAQRKADAVSDQIRKEDNGDRNV